MRASWRMDMALRIRKMADPVVEGLDRSWPVAGWPYIAERWQLTVAYGGSLPSLPTPEL